jgi:transposase
VHLYFPYPRHPQELHDRARDLRTRGLTNREVAATLGIGLTTVRRWLGPERNRTSAKRAALTLRSRGMSYRDIAREVGEPRSTVHDWCRHG